ncbi:DUF3014 domain-containing protein [Geoalkalibacter sp.]|uniref:DUF3014 domain-containing protein n=1 Tax=Geoalkalibacter sp. TaxID=3041440 RepID=UPI00272DDA27|nr:DUF3014 domain-containing protein [Geoalkalibacter sp.]
MKNPFVWIGILVAGALAVFFWQGGRPEKHTPVAEVERQPMPQPAEAPKVLYPIPAQAPPPTDEAATETPTTEPATPLPELEDSDPLMVDTLARFFPVPRLDELFVLNNLIKRIVVTIDNLPRKEVPLRLLPTRPTPGSFLVEGEGDNAVISPKNALRYAPLVNLFAAVDTSQALAVYIRLYPLFQQAYRELGYPDGYFNDRLVEVIDHLLATPEVEQPVRLKPHIQRFRYADPQLEALSAGQKLMIRIGPDNAGKIKEKLADWRQKLTR